MTTASVTRSSVAIASVTAPSRSALAVTVLTSLLCWAVIGVCRAADPSPRVEVEEARQCAATLDAVFDAIQEHHISPPTRQEMVLAMARFLRADEPPSETARLSTTISNIAGKEALHQLMIDEIGANGAKLQLDPERLDHLNLSWLDPIVPGGVQLDRPKDVDVQQQLAANRYVGIGVAVAQTAHSFTFREVMENGPAANAGILPGDRLIEIDGQPIKGKIEDTIDQLRGPEGSAFRVIVQTGDQPPRELELLRKVVVMKSMNLRPIDQGDTTAVIDVNKITASSTMELQSIIEKLPDSIRQLHIVLQFDGNFHYFHLFADALLEEGILGELYLRDGRRQIRTSPGTVLAGRTLKLELKDRDRQQQLLSVLALRVDAKFDKQDHVLAEPMYLQESIPILDGRAAINIATRQFVPGVPQ